VCSKYALLGLVETLRIELAEEGIGVSAILPGPMRTTHLASSQAAKPGTSDTPVFTPESIRVVAAATMGEIIDAEHATRNVIADLEADRPYIFTHFVHEARIRERIDELLQALERARR